MCWPSLSHLLTVFMDNYDTVHMNLMLEFKSYKESQLLFLYASAFFPILKIR